MARQISRLPLIALPGILTLAGCFPRMPTNPASQQPASTNASFSPDGSEILYAANHDGAPEIYVVGADGSDRRQLNDNGGQDFFPSRSPDGNTIRVQLRSPRTWWPTQPQT